MKQSYQTILLVDHVAEAIDCIIDTCNAASLPPVKISTAFSAQYAAELLAENEFSVLVIGIGENIKLAEISDLTALHAPKPTIVILPSGSSDQVIPALRSGASDVFLQDTVCDEKGEFLNALDKLLKQADLIEKNFHYRDELQRSLDELKADQQAALQIQQNMLPDKEVDCGAIKTSFLVIPSLYLSGDFVDVVPIDSNRTLFYLADVSGHGASSALVTVLLKNMTNRLLRNFRRGSSFDILTPIDTLHRINSELLDTGLGKHLSIFLGLYDAEDSKLIYAVGGHHPMPILRKGDEASFLVGRGMPVGLFPEPMFEQKEICLGPEFELAVFSDGILEMLPEETMDDMEQRLLKAVIETKGAGPEEIKQSLLPGIINDAPDDIAIMTISRR
ncbi:MAG: PP2C family protein-serine/threonine phosphatase [Neptuniibacter sp.]